MPQSQVKRKDKSALMRFGRVGEVKQPVSVNALPHLGHIGVTIKRINQKAGELPARFELGATCDAPFVFDNEKWAHPVNVEPFQMALAPVTNGDFADFVEDFSCFSSASSAFL